MTRIEFLAKQISKVVNVEVTIDFTTSGEIMIDHAGNINQKVLDYFKSQKTIDVEYDAESDWTFYTFAA